MLKDKFIYWYYNQFHTSHLFQAMEYTCEGSPYHMERNVGVHTNMVVAQYLALTTKYWNKFDLHGALACVFHDTGKPVAKEERYSEERGKYFRFSGHELISARIWENWALENLDEIRQVYPEFDGHDIYAVGWMIEKHLPWGIKDENKLDALAKTAMAVNSDGTGIDATPSSFLNFLRSDGLGRICDDDKAGKSEVWLKEFTNRCIRMTYGEEKPHYENGAPTLYMPIGVSGAGKSTMFKDLKRLNPDLIHYSWDDLRLKYYLTEEDSELDVKEQYRKVFERSIEKGSKFKERALKDFNDAIKTGNSIYIDNMNLTRKRRAAFTTEAKRKGYIRAAVLIPTPLETLVERQKTRLDKSLAPSDVARQFYSLQYPQFGEFDTVIINPI